jgi:hypothetical protein
MPLDLAPGRASRTRMGEAALTALPGRTRRGRGRARSLAGLYANPRRRCSRERDVGLCWRSGDGRTYRAALILDTGELYTFEHGSGGAVSVLGRLEPGALDDALPGWREVCGRDGSYEWLCARMRRVVTAPSEARR